MKLKPVEILPFKLYNIQDFLNREHPVYFPESPNYEVYWTEQAKRCVEGFWGHDFADGNGGWRFMPGNLYFYINFFPILHEGDQGTEFSGFPMLRDVDWLQFYAFLVCDGFAGFSDDDQHTCFRPVGKIEAGETLSNKEKKLLEKYDKYVRRSDGRLKKYVDAKEYAYRTFREPMGTPLFLNEASNLILLSSRGIGKDLWEESIVYKEEGPVKIKDIVVGDRVYGADGNLTKVVDVAKYNNQVQYEVELDDGRVVICGDGHLWEVYLPGKSEPWVLPLKEIRHRYKGSFRKDKGDRDRHIFVRICDPIQFPEKKLPLDPYFLGVWLGDGTGIRAEVTTMDKEIVEVIYNTAEAHNCEVRVFYKGEGNKAKTYKIVRPNGSQTNPVITKLRDIGVLENKHIPTEYLHASYDQRLALLQGLLDTDGSIGEVTGAIEFTSKHEHLAKEVQYLARSLGIYAKLTSRRIMFMKDPKSKNIVSFEKEGGRVYYRVKLRTGLPVFRLPRKLERIKEGVTATATKRLREKNAIVDIREVGVRPSVCIGVDNGDHLFVTDNFVVTHNSFGTCGGVATYDFVFNGARTIYDYLEKRTSTTVVVGAGMSNRSKEFLAKFTTGYDFLRTNIGAYQEGEYSVPGCFWTPFEGSVALNSSITNSVKIKGGKGYEGAGSKIVHVSYQQSPSAGVGYRARRMIVEEAGLLEQFKAVHSENSATQKRETKIGYTIYLGTGGDIEKIRQIRDAFYNPESYDCVPFPDVFNGTGKTIGLFVPAYYRSALFKDANGNTNIQAAFDDEMLERDKMRKDGSKSYEGHIISYPILPQEMFMQSGGNAFPTDLIEARINDLETSGEYKKYSVGSLHYLTMQNTLCEWREDTRRDLKPILRYAEEEKMSDKRGGIVVYEHPKDNKPEPTYHNPRYIVLYDPVAKDGIGTSLCCVLVFKMWDFGHPEDIQYNIVAEWFGRHERQEDNHEIAFKLAAYYGAKILPEINNTDILRYAMMTNRYNWLQPRPGLALDGMLKQRRYEVGVKISPGMIPHLEAAANEYLISGVDTTTYIDGKDVLVADTKAVSQMRSMRVLEELLYYNRDDNFDGVSTLFLLAVWLRQQKQQPLQYEVSLTRDEDSQALKKFFTNTDVTKHPAFSY